MTKVSQAAAVGRAGGKWAAGKKADRRPAEIRAAEDIRDFYGERPAPLPDGVAPASEGELAAVDAEQW